MNTLNNPVIEDFIIKTTLIDPVSKIIDRLKSCRFRDCDISWLDAKLEEFTEFACKTLGVAAIMPSKIEAEKYTLLNDYLIKQYIERFSILLDYFKSF